MTYRRLALQALLAAAVLVAANLGVSAMARNSVPRQLLRRAERAEPATDLFLGNSTMAAGLDEGAFAAAKPGRPLNLALGASGPVEHALIHRRQAKHRGATVYYGFFDCQLTDLPAGGWGDLVGNRAMGYYVEPEAAIGFYASASSPRAFAFRLAARVPIFVERYTIWSKVEKFRRWLGEIGLPREKVGRFGRTGDFSSLEADPEEFARRCARASARRAPLGEPIKAIFQQSRRWGSPVCVVEMPMPAQHRRRFYDRPEWKAYRELLVQGVREAGGEYVSAADWVGDDGFADPLHLNAIGAREFSARLGRWGEATR